MFFVSRLSHANWGFGVYVLVHVPLLISAIAIVIYDFKVSNGEQGKYFQGDMVLSPEQRHALLSNTSKQLLRDRFQRWPNGTVFYYSDDADDDIRWKVNRTAGIIEDAVPCIRFRQLERSSLRHQPDFVHITDNKPGCFSEVGYRKGLQVMNIHKKQCNSLGIILHQMLHVLGMEHTHSNHNRDQYVKIMWDNIQDEQKDNFEKFTKDHLWDYYFPYDYSSIMHCGIEHFSKNKKPTVIPKDSTAKIGQRLRLSDLDVLKLKLLYCSGNIQIPNLADMSCY